MRLLKFYFETCHINYELIPYIVCTKHIPQNHESIYFSMFMCLNYKQQYNMEVCNADNFNFT